METTTLTFADFLRARIAEEVETAEHVLAALARMPMRPGGLTFNGRDVYELRRVAREVDAKLQIVELHADGRDDWSRLMSDPKDPGYCRVCMEGDIDAFRYPCPTLRALASIYADHPDYREEWRA